METEGVSVAALEVHLDLVDPVGPEDLEGRLVDSVLEDPVAFRVVHQAGRGVRVDPAADQEVSGPAWT